MIKTIVQDLKNNLNLNVRRNGFLLIKDFIERSFIVLSNYRYQITGRRMDMTEAKIEKSMRELLIKRYNDNKKTC